MSRIVPLVSRGMILAGMCFGALCLSLSSAAVVLASETGDASSSMARRPAKAPTGKQLLTLSAGVMATAQSYQLKGMAKVKATGARGQKNVPEQSQLIEGAFSGPDKVYSRFSVTAPKSGSLELYSNGQNAYGKASGDTRLENAPADQWVTFAKGYVVSTSNPVSSMQLLSTSGQVSAGSTQTVDGKSYSTVLVKLTSEQVKKLLGGVLSAAEIAVSGAYGQQIKGSSNAQATLTYFIDPKTYISEITQYYGTEILTFRDGTSSTLSFSGDLKLSGYNEAVSLPDVSGAITLPSGVPSSVPRP